MVQIDLEPLRRANHDHEEEERAGAIKKRAGEHRRRLAESLDEAGAAGSARSGETEQLGAASGERAEARSGYRAGYYSRGLVTRIGKLELRVPLDRHGQFSTALFERYARSEKAPVAVLAEMYVQGLSTRKVKAITEELCGHSSSASAISNINQSLDETLERFATRQLEEAYPYLIVDASYEKVRESGVIRSMAVRVAIGINWEGQRQVLAVDVSIEIAPVVEPAQLLQVVIVGLARQVVQGVARKVHVARA
jgi:putative transposase